MPIFTVIDTHAVTALRGARTVQSTDELEALFEVFEGLIPQMYECANPTRDDHIEIVMASHSVHIMSWDGGGVTIVRHMDESEFVRDTELIKVNDVMNPLPIH